MCIFVPRSQVEFTPLLENNKKGKEKDVEASRWRTEKSAMTPLTVRLVRPHISLHIVALGRCCSAVDVDTKVDCTY